MAEHHESDRAATLIVAGDLVQDTVVWLAEPLQIGSDTKGDVHITRGGSAANVACAAAGLVPTRFIGCVGTDFLGDLVASSLEEFNIDVRLQRRGSTGVVVVLIDDDGERTMVPSRGASALLCDVDPDWLADVAVLHLTAYSLESGTTASEVVRLARLTHKSGGLVTIDTSSSAVLEKFGIDRFFDSLSEIQPDVVFANRQEWDVLSLTEVVVDRPAALESTVFVCKAGADPTTVHPPEGTVITVPVPHVDGVLDTTGAGDAFAGGFLARLVEGASWRECCETGHAIAAHVLTRPGAGSTLPT